VHSTGSLAEALERADHTVVCAPTGSGLGALLEACGGPATPAHFEWVALAAATEKEQWDAAPITHALKSLLAAAAVVMDDVVVARVDDAIGALADVPIVAAADLRLPVARTHATSIAAAQRAAKKAKKKGRGVLALNLAAQPVKDAQRLAVRDPWVAAHLLFQLAVIDLAIDRQAAAAAATLAVQKRNSNERAVSDRGAW
jgi:hypothetical protein